MNSEQHDILIRIDERVGALSDGFKTLSTRTDAIEKRQDRQDGAWKAVVVGCVAFASVAGLIIAVVVG